MFIGRNYFDSWKLNHSIIFHMIDCEGNPLMFWTIVFLILAWAQNAGDDVLTVGHFAVPDDPVNHRPHCVHPHELNRDRSKGSPFFKSDLSMWALPKYLLTPPPPYPRPLCQTDTRRHLFARRRTFYEGWQKALLKKGLLLEVNIQLLGKKWLLSCLFQRLIPMCRKTGKTDIAIYIYRIECHNIYATYHDSLRWYIVLYHPLSEVVYGDLCNWLSLFSVTKGKRLAANQNQQKKFNRLAFRFVSCPYSVLKNGWAS